MHNQQQLREPMNASPVAHCISHFAVSSKPNESSQQQQQQQQESTTTTTSTHLPTTKSSNSSQDAARYSSSPRNFPLVFVGSNFNSSASYGIGANVDKMWRPPPFSRRQAANGSPIPQPQAEQQQQQQQQQLQAIKPTEFSPAIQMAATAEVAKPCCKKHPSGTWLSPGASTKAFAETPSSQPSSQGADEDSDSCSDSASSGASSASMDNNNRSPSPLSSAANQKKIPMALNFLNANISIEGRAATAIITKQDWIKCGGSAKTMKVVSDFLVAQKFIQGWNRSAPKVRRYCLPPYANIGEVFDKLKSEYMGTITFEETNPLQSIKRFAAVQQQGKDDSYEADSELEELFASSISNNNSNNNSNSNNDNKLSSPTTLAFSATTSTRSPSPRGGSKKRPASIRLSSADNNDEPTERCESPSTPRSAAAARKALKTSHVSSPSTAEGTTQIRSPQASPRSSASSGGFCPRFPVVDKLRDDAAELEEAATLLTRLSPSLMAMKNVVGLTSSPSKSNPNDSDVSG